MINSTSLLKFKNLNSFNNDKDFNLAHFKHSLRFATIYLPGTLKDIRLYFRKELCSDSLLDYNYNQKILIKQSYMLLIWFYYLTSSLSTKKKDDSNTKDSALDEIEDEVINIPKFFIYPKNNYKTTIQKAPMAHKTFSQEQYMVRYYTISIVFVVKANILDADILTNLDAIQQLYPVNGVNSALYFGLHLFNNMPYFSTNFL